MADLQKYRKQLHNNKILSEQQANQNRSFSHLQKTINRQWGLYSHQRNLQPKQQIINKKSSNQTEFNVLKYNKNWQYYSKHKFVSKILPKNIYYPPNCSGYDMTYCKSNDTLYIYGGISCSSSLIQGIKQYFYKYNGDKWSQIKPQSVYVPSPRYGHTITAYQKDLILFGGVSQYKQKLKDRCFYADFSAYSTSKNCWKVIESSGHYVKTRKNHAATIYNKFYIIYGGLNQSQQIINEINWINIDCKKSCWKSFKIQGRFNHKMVVVEPQSGRDFLCIFGGRNTSSQITNSLFYVPFTIYNGQLQLKDSITINHTIQARQFPIMTNFHQGFIILGGINQNSDMVQDCWHYNSQKQTIQQIKMDMDIKDLRGAKGYSLGQKIYILAGNNLNYKAIQIQIQK